MTCGEKAFELDGTLVNARRVARRRGRSSWEVEVERIRNGETWN